jgi:hypothetical protein
MRIAKGRRGGKRRDVPLPTPIIAKGGGLGLALHRLNGLQCIGDMALRAEV